MKILLKSANIAIGVAMLVVLIGTLLFNGDEDAMSAVGVATFATAMGVHFYLSERFLGSIDDSDRS